MIPIKIPVTFFAPPERVPIDIVHRQATLFTENPATRNLLDGVLNYVFVLNAQRQIVFASQNVIELTPGLKLKDLLGKRPGEVLGCIHAGECAGGCGTSQYCCECGAVHAVLSSIGGKRDIQECRLTRWVAGREEALDLLVLGTPLNLDGETFSLVSIVDISHQKRRQVLEQVVFHDIFDLAADTHNLLGRLRQTLPQPIQGELEMSRASVQDLLDEIETLRDLARAEQQTLSVEFSRVHSIELLQDLLPSFQRHPLAKDRELRLAPEATNVAFETAPVHLRRVLGLLIKNALEAPRPGDRITVGCDRVGNQVQFKVHNPQTLPPKVQLQVFNRSFTTKGVGRGLGTYSAKLLTENCLKGYISFRTALSEGTTFFVSLRVSDP